MLFAAATVVTFGLRCAAAQPDATALAALIDRHIEARLKMEKLQPAERADDAAFIRRVHLDLHGVIPSAAQAAKFLDDANPAKRAVLIDLLLDSPRYGEHLADLWQGYLISPLADEQPGARLRFRKWLADRFNQQTWDRIAADLLTASGTMEQNPAVTYLIEGRHPRTVVDLTDLSSRYFLGVRLNCAQCHDHPFVDWTQRDYWGMAAFFAQIQTPGKAKMVYTAGVRDDPRLTLREVGMLDGFVSRPPMFLGGEELVAGKETNRAALAQWLTSAKNPWFARAMVNRMWSHFFGRGIVNPVDDMHSANAASHPELLEALSAAFVESGFDLKFLCRAIAGSRVYQRTSRADAPAPLGSGPDKQAALFGRMQVKVLSGGQLYDSLVAVLGTPAKEAGVDGRRDARTEFTRFFAKDGDPDPTAYERGIPQLLRLMNSRQFANGNIAALVARLAKDREAEEVAAELYLTVLSRRPTAAERQVLKNHLREAESVEAACRDLVWALLMSSEFSLNR